MAGPRPSDQYNPVPSVSSEVGMPNDYLSVRANPNQFGGNIGEAVKQAGGQLEQTGEQVAQIALQKQGMLNETLASQAESKYIVASGQIDSSYRTKTGLDAVAAKDQAIADTVKIREQMRAQLSSQSPMAARAFDQLTLRREGYQVESFNSYAAQQQVHAYTESKKTTVQLAINNASVRDELQFGSQLGHIQSAVSDIYSAPDSGYSSFVQSQDPKTGKLVFQDSPQGHQAQAAYDFAVQEAQGKAWETHVRTIAEDPTHGNVQTAMKYLQDNKPTYDSNGKQISGMPTQVYADLSSKYTPQFKIAQSKDFALSAVSDAKASWLNTVSNQVNGKTTPDQLYNTFAQQESNNGQTSQNVYQIQPGTFKDYAVSGHTNYSNEQDRQLAAKNYIQSLNKKYNGDSERVAVAYFSGPQNVSPAGSPTPWINDVADKNGKLTSSYVTDISNKLGAGKTGYTSETDYYRTHLVDIGQQAYDKYSTAHSDDAQGAEYARSQAITHVSQFIQQQEASVRADIDKSQNYITQNNLTDPEQMKLAPPDVQQSWNNVWSNNALAANGLVNGLMRSNAMQASIGYGRDFWKYTQQALDGNMKDAHPLLNSISSEKGGALTGPGYKALNEVIPELQTPQGQAAGQAASKFFQSMHNLTTGMDVSPGIQNNAGEERFVHYMQEVFPRFANGLKNGLSSGQMFDPKSKDYIGDASFNLKPTLAQWQKEVFQTQQATLANGQTPNPTDTNTNIPQQHNLNQMTNSETYRQQQQMVEQRAGRPFNTSLIQDKNDLFRAVRDKRISREQFDQTAVRLGLVKAVPEITINAPGIGPTTFPNQ